MTSLPLISARNGSKPVVKQDVGQKPAGRDAAQESVSDWTPHDVAEWLYLQGTKDDHAHTFLVHNIDGPALLGLTREKLLDWRIKPIDCATILKGVQDLQRIEGGQVGWQPQDEYQVDQPKPPASTKPIKSTPRRKPVVTVVPSSGNSNELPRAETAPSKSGPLPTPREGNDWSVTTVTPMSPTHQKQRLALDSAGSQRKVDPAHTPYLRKVMGDLHASERVPLWKEEMVERVKRTAQGRKQRDPLSHSAPPTARFPSAPSLTGRTRVPSEDSFAASSMNEIGTGRRLAREVERKLIWYQDAIHEQELQSQLLEQKVMALQSQVQEMLEYQKQHPGLPGVGLAEMEKEMRRREKRELGRLSRNLQVSEQRVADAERVNGNMMDAINNLRRGRADFLHQLARLNEREATMTADMKHFAQIAHTSLDEKEKADARLKRQQFDYKVEGHHYETVLENLDSEIQGLDENISSAHHAEEQQMQKDRQANFRKMKSMRDAQMKRDQKLGYLQNHVRSQEMDFQRLHRIMGVKFTPEKPESVNEIVSTSLEHEQRNASLLQFVAVQTAQLEALEEEIRALSKEEEDLTLRAAKRSEMQLNEQTNEMREETLGNRMGEQVQGYESTLQKLCPLVTSLCEVTGALIDPKDDLALKGCRPDTLADHLRLIDEAIKDLRTRAAALPTASGNEWLRDFLAPKTVSEHPNVFDHRKELEIAAQKQKEQKAFNDNARDGCVDSILTASTKLDLNRTNSNVRAGSASMTVPTAA